MPNARFLAVLAVVLQAHAHVGGFGDAKPVTPEVQELFNSAEAKAAIGAKLGAAVGGDVTVVSFKTQVVRLLHDRVTATAPPHAIV